MPPGEEIKTGDENPGANAGGSTPSVEPVKAKTEAVDVTKLTQEDENTIQVEWGSSDGGKENAFFDAPTKAVADPKPAGSSGSSPAASSSAASTPKGPSFEIGIKVLIAIIDFIMSNVLCKIAGDKTSHAYTADKTSKDNLTDSLMLIMEENRVKIPNWLVVLFAFLAAYGFQIMAAIDSRKEKSQGKKDNTGVTASAKDALKPGVYEKDGKLWRRYQNGAVHERRFRQDGTEIIIGQPSRRRILEAA